MQSILQPAAWHALDCSVPILAAILLFISSAALAQSGLKYRVEINAPKDMAEVLSKGLNLERWQNDPQMTPEQLRRLADEAKREARELAATEGYFSAQVEVTIEEGPQPWTVRLVLQPGQSVPAFKQGAPGLRVIVGGGELTESVPDQPDRGMKPRTGEYFWQEAGITRAVRNSGTTALNLVEVELK